MNYLEARAVFLETAYAHQAAWARSGRKEDQEGKFAHQSIERLYEEVMEDGPKLATPEWFSANYDKPVPENCIAVLVHDIGSEPRMIDASMTMDEFCELLSDYFGFPAED